mmetsp:Transcript_13291/g.22299  ORF Transcript_13291/g.22299 Transcript_13291/m.22299 type:complete len:166 (+) Transcript_13291:1627-2124(+)
MVTCTLFNPPPPPPHPQPTPPLRPTPPLQQTPRAPQAPPPLPQPPRQETPQLRRQPSLGLRNSSSLATMLRAPSALGTSPVATISASSFHPAESAARRARLHSDVLEVQTVAACRAAPVAEVSVGVRVAQPHRAMEASVPFLRVELCLQAFSSVADVERCIVATA